MSRRHGIHDAAAPATCVLSFMGGAHEARGLCWLRRSSRLAPYASLDVAQPTPVTVFSDAQSGQEEISFR